ncbi:MAG: hypothetical protein AAGC54_18425 [Cyanobacteria bacterium P01_F01_bin.4]
MKPMVWAPEEKDQKVNQYLESINHAPYEMIAVVVMGLFCLFTAAVLIGNF